MIQVYARVMNAAPWMNGNGGPWYCYLGERLLGDVLPDHRQSEPDAAYWYAIFRKDHIEVRANNRASLQAAIEIKRFGSIGTEKPRWCAL